MRLLLLKMVFVLLIANTSVAQVLNPNKKIEVKAQNSTYVYKSLGPDKMIVVSKKNSIPTVYSEKSHLTHLSSVEYSTAKPISKSVREVFNDTRLKELIQEKPLLVNMYISTEGEIIAVEFLLNPNSKLKPVELEKLENALRKNVSFKLDKEESKGTLMPISQTISFAKILNGTFPV